jgi:hypothetical protein
MTAVSALPLRGTELYIYRLHLRDERCFHAERSSVRDGPYQGQSDQAHGTQAHTRYSVKRSEL